VRKKESMMKIENQIEIINKEFKEGLQAVLGEKLHAAYVYGAAAFNDSLPTGDIDFHVILKKHLTDKEKQELENVHKNLAEKYPKLGRDLDGYYILLEDARKRTPPQSEMWQCAIDNAWALHRQHIWAGRYITLFGGNPKEIYPPSNWDEIEEALFDEIQYIKNHLHQYPDYCILNLCRLIYSFQTRDVVISKAKASEWAYDAIPEWKQLIQLARKSYKRRATEEDRKVMMMDVEKFFEYAILKIDHVHQSSDKTDKILG
jgi:predicted nucleotidyltransferase